MGLDKEEKLGREDRRTLKKACLGKPSFGEEGNKGSEP